MQNNRWRFSIIFLWFFSSFFSILAEQSFASRRPSIPLANQQKHFFFIRFLLLLYLNKSPYGRAPSRERHGERSACHSSRMGAIVARLGRVSLSQSHMPPNGVHSNVTSDWAQPAQPVKSVGLILSTEMTRARKNHHQNEKNLIEKYLIRVTMFCACTKTAMTHFWVAARKCTQRQRQLCMALSFGSSETASRSCQKAINSQFSVMNVANGKEMRMALGHELALCHNSSVEFGARLSI